MTKEARSRTTDEALSTSEAATAHETGEKAEAPEFPFPLPITEMGDLNTNAFEAYVRTSRAILENAAALNQEMVRFAGERFQADLEAIQTLPGYTNVQGVVNFQSDFMRSAAEAYQAEFSKLMQQSNEAISTMFEPLIETAKESKSNRTNVAK